MTPTNRFLTVSHDLRAALERGDAGLRGLFGEGRTFRVDEMMSLGDASHSVYRVASGWISRGRSLSTGQRQLLQIYLPEDIISLRSVFGHASRDAARAISACTIERANSAELREAMRQDADIAMRCLWEMDAEARRMDNWGVSIGRSSAEERLAYFLLQLHARLAAAGVIPFDAVEFHMPMTQEHLGDHLGLSTVHVNRVLKKLRLDGVLTVQGRKLRIDSRERLVQCASLLMDDQDQSLYGTVSVSGTGPDPHIDRMRLSPSPSRGGTVERTH